MNIFHFLKRKFSDSWLHPRHISRVYLKKLLNQAQFYSHGVMLDLGCGLRPYEQLFREKCSHYWGLDWPVHRDKAKIDIQGNALYIPFLDESIDTVLTTELLEHLPDPQQFMKEILRILRPSGTLILSVPFIEPLHEEPRDYFRFTPYGLRFLLKENGFNVIAIYQKGGWGSVVFGSFLSQAIYDVVNPLSLDGFRHNRIFRVILVTPICTSLQLVGYFLDKLFISSKYCLGYVVVATKIS
jgi:SAM-dependent methyltransferase